MTISDLNSQPTFLGIGVQNSGTTWAAGCLEQHPEICMRSKELHFFDEDKYDTRGWSWYSQQFSRVDGVHAYGEWTPEYIFNDLAFQRISNDLDRVKILAIFRSPVDRAYSTYWRYRTSGFTNLEFRDALEEYAFFHERSCYFHPWRRYVQRFGAENCLPLIFEELRHDPQAVFRRIFRFLGVDETFQPDIGQSRRNAMRFNRSQRAVDYLTAFKQSLRNRSLGFLVDGARRIGLRRMLAVVNTTRDGYPSQLRTEEREAIARRYFDDDVDAFSQLINQDLSVWNESGVR